MKPTYAALLLLLPCLPSLAAAPAGNPFAENVRRTAPLSPAEEQKTFHLPPGFEIQLVAAEPDIGKPFNINFDARGRLWVTTSKEYPFPSKTGKGELDRIMILEDFDDTGKARKITTFANDLNIPIGIYPYRDGCLAYSIPNISAYHDTQGTGKADRIDPLYGPFGFEKDTHGMTSNFRRGFDGWLYATHGFNNQSNPKSLKTGQGISMHSGNTYRMKLDGSALENFSYGQTNPFGLVFDPLGFAYASECEAKPVAQLFRGGYHAGLGAIQDGLGFAPDMISYMHGSTAIAGIVLYNDTVFPPEYRDNIFVGNVVTCRINRDSVSYHGGTPVTKLESDLLTTDDPWFRPVNMQLATDGSLFVADFYNRIIGHYEVPLTHPGRDHDHGRIWRIYFRGLKDPTPSRPSMKDQTKETADELIADLASGSLPLRMHATNELSDRVGTAAVDPIRRQLAHTVNDWQKIHGLWVLHRLGALEPAQLVEAAKSQNSPVAVHAMRLLAETSPWTPDQQSLALAGLHSTDPLVQRCAADALSRHPAIDQVRPLLELFGQIPSDDTFLAYQLRLTLRDHLKDDRILTEMAAEKWNSEDASQIDSALLAVPTERAGSYLAARVRDQGEKLKNLPAALKHAIRYAPQAEMESLAVAGPKMTTDPDVQWSLFKSAQDALGQRGVQPGDQFREWATQLAGALLAPESTDAATLSKHRQAAAEIARSMKLREFVPTLQSLVANKQVDDASRSTAVRAVLEIDPAQATALLSIISDAGEPIALREATAQAFGEVRSTETRTAAINAASPAPLRCQSKLASALAGDLDGAELLLQACATAKLSPRLLQDGRVRFRLAVAKVPNLETRIAEITKGLPAADLAVQQLIDKRRAAYLKSKPSIEAGAQLFTKNCAVCHTLEGQGGKVGPTLDGIGNRGLDRLCEDILDPSRNVDPAFRYSSITLKDGSIIDGLQRREEGAVLIFIDATGKEIPIPKDQIKNRRDTNLSLMPSNFGEIIAEKDFNDLMAFLLSKNAMKK
jgi:putative heme-binding domain-containing protein